MIGLGIGLTRNGRRAVAQVITGTAPVLAALSDGDTLSTAVTWGSYASSAGTITGTVQEMSVNGAAFVTYNGATVVTGSDTYQLRETVTDSAANERVFTSGTVTVAAATPAVISDAVITGETLSFTSDKTGTAYLTLVPSGEATPSGANVVAGKKADGVTDAPFTDSEVIASLPASFSFDVSAVADGEYKFCIVMVADGAPPSNVLAPIETIAAATSFPVLEGSAVSTNTNNVDLTQTIPLPAGIASGDRLTLEIFRATDDGFSIPGWTRLGSEPARNHLFTRIADGLEGSTLDITATVGSRMAAISRRFSGAGDIYFAEGLDAEFNTVALTPAGGSGKYIWVSSAMSLASAWVVTEAPSDFSGLLQSKSPSSTAGSRVGVVSAHREFEGATLDPGAFTFTGVTSQPRGFTYAVKGV